MCKLGEWVRVSVFSGLRSARGEQGLTRNQGLRDRGLGTEKPQDWRWSSFRHYATGERGAVEIESFWTEALREKRGEKAIKNEKEP
jgi:hypothetical protein